jgi:hypothetical protein
MQVAQPTDPAEHRIVAHDVDVREPTALDQRVAQRQRRTVVPMIGLERMPLPDGRPRSALPESHRPLDQPIHARRPPMAPTPSLTHVTSQSHSPRDDEESTDPSRHPFG